MDAALTTDSVNIYRLPVGVKCVEQSDESPTDTKHQKLWIKEDSITVLSDGTPSVSWDAVGDRGIEATVSLNNLSKIRKGNYANDSNKQGVLSSRAASMLVISVY